MEGTLFNRCHHIVSLYLLLRPCFAARSWPWAFSQIEILGMGPAEVGLELMHRLKLNPRFPMPMFTDPILFM